jgi:hypothetical protein
MYVLGLLLSLITPAVFENSQEGFYLQGYPIDVVASFLEVGLYQTGNDGTCRDRATPSQTGKA